VLGHGDERLKAHHTDSVLLILGELPEDREDLLKDVLFFELGSKLTKLGSTSTSDHGSVLVTELNELLSQLLLLGARLRVAGKE